MRKLSDWELGYDFGYYNKLPRRKKIDDRTKFQEGVVAGQKSRETHIKEGLNPDTVVMSLI